MCDQPFAVGSPVTCNNFSSSSSLPFEPGDERQQKTTMNPNNIDFGGLKSSGGFGRSPRRLVASSPACEAKMKRSDVSGRYRSAWSIWIHFTNRFHASLQTLAHSLAVGFMGGWLTYGWWGGAQVSPLGCPGAA